LFPFGEIQDGGRFTSAALPPCAADRSAALDVPLMPYSDADAEPEPDPFEALVVEERGHD
jgi:hypothetical protein